MHSLRGWGRQLRIGLKHKCSLKLSWLTIKLKRPARRIGWGDLVVAAGLAWSIGQEGEGLPGDHMGELPSRELGEFDMKSEGGRHRVEYREGWEEPGGHLGNYKGEKYQGRRRRCRAPPDSEWVWGWSSQAWFSVAAVRSQLGWLKGLCRIWLHAILTSS